MYSVTIGSTKYDFYADLDEVVINDLYRKRYTLLKDGYLLIFNIKADEATNMKTYAPTDKLPMALSAKIFETEVLDVK